MPLLEHAKTPLAYCNGDDSHACSYLSDTNGDHRNIAILTSSSAQNLKIREKSFVILCVHLLSAARNTQVHAPTSYGILVAAGHQQKLSSFLESFQSGLMCGKSRLKDYVLYTHSRSFYSAKLFLSGCNPSEYQLSARSRPRDMFKVRFLSLHII
jgi:hypothetical protein